MSHYVTQKDLAVAMQLHPRTVRRWYKRLKVPPTVPGQACNRWTEADADKLLAKWKKWHDKKRKNSRT
jgi:hypothetical protein